MGWKATGQPTVRKQRDRWLVRVDGIDTATGKHRPRQLGTFASQRAALMAARSGKADARSTEWGTGSWLVRRHVAGRTDITVKSRESYEWAIPPHRGWPRCDPHRPPRPRRCRQVDRGLGRRRPALPAQRADLSHRPARCACRSRRRRIASPQSGRPRRTLPHRRQAGQSQGDRCVGDTRGDALPRRQPRPPVGDRVPPRRPLRPPPQRGVGAALGRPRHRGEDIARRPEPCAVNREPHGATPRTSDHTDVSPRRRNPPGPRPPASRAGHRTPPRRGKVG